MRRRRKNRSHQLCVISASLDSLSLEKTFTLCVLLLPTALPSAPTDKTSKLIKVAKTSPLFLLISEDKPSNAAYAGSVKPRAHKKMTREVEEEEEEKQAKGSSSSL